MIVQHGNARRIAIALWSLMVRLTPRSWLVATALVAGLHGAHADNFPSKTVRLILPFAPGGQTDIAGRHLADALQKIWGQSVVVENRAGAGSVVGAAFVAQAPADGYTILIAPSAALAENIALVKDLPYDPVKSFAPVVEIYQLSAGLTVSSKLPVRNLKELVETARTRSLSYSSFGLGSGPHLLLETFKKAAGIDIVHVPYSGMAPGVAALIKGDVDMTGAGLGGTRAYVESGALRMLAVAGDERSIFAPGVSTFDELGYKNVRGGSLFTAVMVPAGTPADIVAKLNRDFIAAAASPAFTGFLNNAGYLKASTSTPDDLARLIKTSIDTWVPFVKSLGLKDG